MTDAIVSTLFFFNDTATTEIYTLSLPNALPISVCRRPRVPPRPPVPARQCAGDRAETRPSSGSSARPRRDRKSTRLNSSHANISYAVFCLKKKTLRPAQRVDEEDEQGDRRDPGD